LLEHKQDTRGEPRDTQEAPRPAFVEREDRTLAACYRSFHKAALARERHMPATIRRRELIVEACLRLGLTKLTREEMRLASYPESTPEIDVCIK
jgi:hypothetical protein